MNQVPNQRRSRKVSAPEEYGQVTAPDTVRINRLLTGSIEQIWAYFTESDKRGKWLAPGKMELRVGGQVELNFRHADLSAEKKTPARFKQYEEGGTIRGRILSCDPPRLLSFTWGEESGKESEVTFELTPHGKNALLMVTHRRLGDRGTMLSVAAGWHTHLGILIDHFDGVEPRPFWTTHAKLVDEYEKRIPAAGAAAKAKSGKR
jgi:uncharacterized protein YndB with AHSA1/START domain